MENVGIQEIFALKLMQFYKPEITVNKPRGKIVKCVNCAKEMQNSSLEPILSDVGLMCNECYAEKEGLTIEQVEQKKIEQDNEERDRMSRKRKEKGKLLFSLNKLY